MPPARGARSIRRPRFQPGLPRDGGRRGRLGRRCRAMQHRRSPIPPQRCHGWRRGQARARDPVPGPRSSARRRDRRATRSGQRAPLGSQKVGCSDSRLQSRGSPADHPTSGPHEGAWTLASPMTADAAARHGRHPRRHVRRNPPRHGDTRRVRRWYARRLGGVGRARGGATDRSQGVPEAGSRASARGDPRAQHPCAQASAPQRLRLRRVSMRGAPPARRQPPRGVSRRDGTLPAPPLLRPRRRARLRGVRAGPRGNGSCSHHRAPG